MTHKAHQNPKTKKLRDVGFDESWESWVEKSIAEGCDKDGLFKILLDAGFDSSLAQIVLNHEPTRPIHLIENPFRPEKTIARTPKDSECELLKEYPVIANADKLDRDDIEFYMIDDFLNAEECSQLIGLIKSKLRPSTLVRPPKDTDFRTSSSCDLGWIENSLLKDVDRRICSMLGLDPAYSESMQGQHYEIGQQFKAHMDYFFEIDTEHMNAENGQRSYTFMIYLNDVGGGGETIFRKIGQVVTPKMGRAVIWNSLHLNGAVNPLTMHQGVPVTHGSKVIITKWFRTLDGLPVMKREVNESIPNFTPTGIIKTCLPPTILQKVTDFYKSGTVPLISEKVRGDGKTDTQIGGNASRVMVLPSTLSLEIQNLIKIEIEKWTELDVESTGLYGIRVFNTGATTEFHRDHIDTQTFGAIINIAQELTEDWPLAIEDNYYRRHTIVLKPGEIICYEGARLSHGRPTPLNGESYASIICHFQILDE